MNLNRASLKRRLAMLLRLSVAGLLITAAIGHSVAWMSSPLAAAEKMIPLLPPLDEDFPLQGEYAGNLTDASGQTRWFGLQVIAHGNGEFAGVMFPGGLPGNGGSNSSPNKLVGWRKRNRLYLAGDDRLIEIALNEAHVYDSRGRGHGKLLKFHRLSRTLGAAPPKGATILFDGTHLERLVGATITAEHLLNVGADTRDSFGDFSLHVEFRTPYMPAARGQARGNSGVYIQERYEVQVLDSFGLVGLNNECGAIYKTHPPRWNLCFPPMSWQTYDIDFTAARFGADGTKTSPARITVRHNGVIVQDSYEIPNKTGAGAAEGPEPRPIRFQHHGDAVNFRNIWIVPGKPAT